MNLRFEILEREEVSFKILCFSAGGWKGEVEISRVGQVEITWAFSNI